MRRWLVWCGLVTLLAISGSAGARAAVTPTENVDEPARNPYQQTITSKAVCSTCNFIFNKVPAGKRLRVTNVSCWFALNSNAGVELTSIRDSTRTGAIFYMPAILQGNGLSAIINSDISLVIDAGKSPVITMVTDFNFATTSICTVSGYMISL